MKNKPILLAAVGVLFGGAGAMFGPQQRTRPAAPAAEAPAAVEALLAQSLTDSQGQPQALAQWRHKPLIVNFWATWCAPCVEEMPELDALQKEIAPQGMQILGIGIDSPTKIAEFARSHQIGYPLYAAGMQGTALAQQFGNQAGVLPYTVLGGRDGTIGQKYIGRLKIDKLRQDLQSL